MKLRSCKFLVTLLVVSSVMTGCTKTESFIEVGNTPVNPRIQFVDYITTEDIEHMSKGYVLSYSIIESIVNEIVGTQSLCQISDEDTTELAKEFESIKQELRSMDAISLHSRVTGSCLGFLMGIDEANGSLENLDVYTLGVVLGQMSDSYNELVELGATDLPDIYVLYDIVSSWR